MILMVIYIINFYFYKGIILMEIIMVGFFKN